jgi:hypothetical protein
VSPWPVPYKSHLAGWLNSLITSQGNLASPHNPENAPPSTTLNMFFSVAVVVSALSLLSSTHALALVNRQSDCSFVCPRADADGNGLSTFTKINDTSFSCTYPGAFESPCTYNSVSVPYPRACGRFVDVAFAVLWRDRWGPPRQSLPTAGNFSVPSSPSPRRR